VGGRRVECFRSTKTPGSPSVLPRIGSSPRFHLEGVEAGRRVSIFKIDPCMWDLQLAVPSDCVASNTDEETR
jgi:hypothetical protein